jgi:hypothetical protein
MESGHERHGVGEIRHGARHEIVDHTGRGEAQVERGYGTE